MRSRSRTRCQPAHSGEHTVTGTSATAMPAIRAILGCLVSRFGTYSEDEVRRRVSRRQSRPLLPRGRRLRHRRSNPCRANGFPSCSVRESRNSADYRILEERNYAIAVNSLLTALGFALVDIVFSLSSIRTCIDEVLMVSSNTGTALGRSRR